MLAELRAEEWEAAARESVVPLRLTRMGPRFRGGLIRHELRDGVVVVKATGDPHTFERTADLIESADSALILQLNVEGESQLVQRGAHARVGGGSAVVFDTAAPYTLDISEMTTSYLVVVPREALCLSEADLRCVLARPLARGAAGIRLLSSMLEATTPTAAELHPEERSVLAGSITDSLRIALTAARPTPTVRARESLLDMLIATVREELHDHTLSADYLAARHFVSVRAVYYAFELQHTTPARFIQLTRLRRGSELLLGGMRVHEVATACGFRDSSTFSRAFRRQFGVAPSVWRTRSPVRNAQAGINRW